MQLKSNFTGSIFICITALTGGYDIWGTWIQVLPRDLDHVSHRISDITWLRGSHTDGVDVIHFDVDE